MQINASDPSRPSLLLTLTPDAERYWFAALRHHVPWSPIWNSIDNVREAIANAERVVEGELSR